MEDSPSGLWRTLGKRVGVTASRVRISYPPPGLEPRKPLKSFGFRGFALVPSDCRFPPFRHLWPRPAARVTYRNRRFRKRLRAFARRVFVIEVRPRPMCPVSGPIRVPSCSPRSFFVLVRNNPSLRIASASQRIPVGPARRFPLTPSDERHTNAYLNLGTLPTPLPRFLGTFLSTEMTSQVRTMPSTKHPYRHIRQHITFAR